MKNELESKAGAIHLPMKFEYPLALKLLLAVGAAFFLACALLSGGLVSQGKLSAMVQLTFLGFGLLSTYIGLALVGRVVLSDDAIIFHRLGKTTTISYTDIIEILDKTIGQQLIIRDAHDSIKIEKQLRDFPLFYALIMQRAPLFHRPSRLDLPLEIHLFRWIPVVQLALLIIGLGVIVLAINDRTEVWSYGMLLLSVGILSFVFLPRHYIIDTAGIVVVYTMRSKIYRWSDLRKVQLTRPRNPRTQTEITQIHFEFTRGKLALNENSLDYPLTRLMLILQDALGEMPVWHEDIK